MAKHKNLSELNWVFSRQQFFIRSRQKIDIFQKYSKSFPRQKNMCLSEIDKYIHQGKAD